MSLKEKIAFIYRVVIVIISAIGLYLNFKLTTFRLGILYFTNLSNLLCLIYFLVILILTVTKRLKKNDFYYISKGMVTMAITLTMFVYNVVLSSSGTMTLFENHMLECNLVHVIVPLLVIFDYIIFGTKGKLKKTYPYIWSLILILYQLFVMIYGYFGGKFADGASVPYFYMDIGKYGLDGVLINSLIILVFFIGYGSIIQTLDNKLAEVKKVD